MDYLNKKITYFKEKFNSNLKIIRNMYVPLSRASIKISFLRQEINTLTLILKSFRSSFSFNVTSLRPFL